MLHFFVQSQQWKHQNKIREFDIEQVNADWLTSAI